MDNTEVIDKALDNTKQVSASFDEAYTAAKDKDIARQEEYIKQFEDKQLETEAQKNRERYSRTFQTGLEKNPYKEQDKQALDAAKAQHKQNKADIINRQSVKVDTETPKQELLDSYNKRLSDNNSDSIIKQLERQKAVKKESLKSLKFGSQAYKDTKKEIRDINNKLDDVKSNYKSTNQLVNYFSELYNAKRDLKKESLDDLNKILINGNKEEKRQAKQIIKDELDNLNKEFNEKAGIIDYSKLTDDERQLLDESKEQVNKARNTLVEHATPVALRNAYLIYDFVSSMLRNVGRALPQVESSPAYTKTPMEMPELMRIWQNQINKQSESNIDLLEKGKNSILEALTSKLGYDNATAQETIQKYNMFIENGLKAGLEADYLMNKLDAMEKVGKEYQEVFNDPEKSKYIFSYLLADAKNASEATGAILKILGLKYGPTMVEKIIGILDGIGVSLNPNIVATAKSMTSQTFDKAYSWIQNKLTGASPSTRELSGQAFVSPELQTIQEQANKYKDGNFDLATALLYDVQAGRITEEEAAKALSEEEYYKTILNKAPEFKEVLDKFKFVWGNKLLSEFENDVDSTNFKGESLDTNLAKNFVNEDIVLGANGWFRNWLKGHNPLYIKSIAGMVNDIETAKRDHNNDKYKKAISKLNKYIDEYGRDEVLKGLIIAQYHNDWATYLKELAGQDISNDTVSEDYDVLKPWFEVIERGGAIPAEVLDKVVFDINGRIKTAKDINYLNYDNELYDTPTNKSEWNYPNDISNNEDWASIAKNVLTNNKFTYPSERDEYFKASDKLGNIQQQLSQLQAKLENNALTENDKKQLSSLKDQVNKYEKIIKDLYDRVARRYK